MFDDLPEKEIGEKSGEGQISAAARVAEKVARKKSERFTYLVAAVMSSLGITSMAVSAVYCRFFWQMEVTQLRFSYFCLIVFCNSWVIGYLNCDKQNHSEQSYKRNCRNTDTVQ